MDVEVCFLVLFSQITDCQPALVEVKGGIEVIAIKLKIPYLPNYGKWFEPRSLSRLCGLIVPGESSPEKDCCW